MLEALTLLLLLSTPTQTTPAEELLELHIVRGDLLLGRVDGRLAAFAVAGVWVPFPSGHAKTAQYMGDEARERTAELVRDERILIDMLVPPSAEQPWPVRVRTVGPDGGEGFDLAILLAEAGLALCDKRATPDPEHAEAICAAEKRARRAHRGMHDGGYLAFTLAQRTHKDLGKALWHKAKLARYAQRYYEGPPPTSTQRGGYAFWDRPMVSTLHRNPVAAIRDWGRSLGLPPDSSSRGR